MMMSGGTQSISAFFRTIIAIFYIEIKPKTKRMKLHEKTDVNGI